MIATRSATTALAVLTLFALSACTPATPPPTSSTATPEPTVTATAAATPTPTPDVAVAATVVLTAASIAVLDAARTVIVDIPFTTNGDDAADQLAEALGVTPLETVRDGQNCARPGTIYDFGGLVVDGAGEVISPPPAVFSASVRATETPTGVVLEGPAGLRIGASLDEVLAAVPGSVPSEDGFANTYVNLEVISGAGTPDEVGVLGVINSGALISINAPLYIFGDC